MQQQNSGVIDVEAPEMMPERWETAVEDLAQVVALGLDRAQDLADVVNDVVRTHPLASRVAAAGAVGLLVGGALGGLRRPRQANARVPKAPAAKATPVPRAAIGLRQLAPLGPIALSLLKNPTVRDLLMRGIMSAARRRPR